MRTSIRSEKYAGQAIVITCLLVVAWAYANMQSLKWLFESFRQASFLNILLNGLMVVVLLVQVVRFRRRRAFKGQSYILSATPVLRSHPLLLMLGSALSAIALQWLVDIEQLTVFLFLLGTYGLCGLFLVPSLWRQGLPIASLVACIVPLSFQLSTGLGIPARILTAHAVEQLLSAWHVAVISSYDIIVLENGVAHVDVPCSGLKSLWTGTLFLLAATWIENRKLGVRWLLVCCSNWGFLLLVNTVRVLVLVVVTQVLKQPQFAQMLHIPLGLIGLCCACALSWIMLQTVPKQEETGKAGEDGEAGACFQTLLASLMSVQIPLASPLKRGTLSRFSPLKKGGAWGGSKGLKTRPRGAGGEEKLQVAGGDAFSSDISQGKFSPASCALPASLAAQSVLVIFVFALAVFAQIYHPQEEQPLSVASLTWPKQMVSEGIPLTAPEQNFFDKYPFLVPQKQRFVLGDISGSILVVANTTWRTYHPPEMCLLAIGLKVDQIERKRLTSAVQARWLSIADGRLSATYWFQSPKQTTDDFLSRLWSDVTRRQKNWVLVSVLFDSALSPDSAEVRDFATTIHNAIDHSLQRGERLTS